MSAPNSYRAALLKVRAMIRGTQTEYQVVDFNNPDVGLGQYLDEVLSQPDGPSDQSETVAHQSATGAIELLRKVLAAHERLHASGTHGLPLSLKNEIAAAIAATDSGSDK